jgi:hypothetical protein
MPADQSASCPCGCSGRPSRTALPDIELPPVSGLLAEPSSLRGAKAAAGYVEVRLETLDQSVHIGSPSGAWGLTSSSAPGLAVFLDELPRERLAAVRDVFVEAVVSGVGPDPTELPVEVIVGIGQRHRHPR